MELFQLEESELLGKQGILKNILDGDYNNKYILQILRELKKYMIKKCH